MSSLETYVISQRRPYRYVLLTIIAVVAALVIQWYFYQKHDRQDQQLLTQLQSQQQKLNDANSKLKQHNSQLSIKLREQQQQLAMQIATDQQLQKQLNELQNNLIDLNKELTFYQTITQGNGTTELQIRELQLKSIPNDALSFSYRLVITQGKKIINPIQGNITVSISDKKHKDSLRTVDQHPLHLRHVQVVDGVIKLIQQHTPDTITVTLSQNKKVLTSRSFDWQVDQPPTQ